MSSERFLNDKWNKKLDKKVQNIIDRVGLDRKTLDEVFDKSTLLSLDKLISNRVIDILDFPISTGKEGNIFRGVTPSKKLVAVKIYRTSTSTFKHISKYIIGDPRFKNITKNRRDLVHLWTQKEYKNLQRMNEARIRAPKPITRINNVLVMEYIGTVKKPAPMMRDVNLKKPEEIFNTLVNFIEKMYKKAKLVHSDISAFNVLIHQNKPYLIDVGQAVLLEHPLAYDFLKRDIHNLANYFKKYNLKSDEQKIYNKITKNKGI